VFRKKYKKRGIYFRTNWQISAPQVRLLDEQGKQIGIFSIQDARKKAQEADLDLVEIAPRAKPPVAKIINYSKFKYQEERKQREEKKRQKGGLKEVRMTPFIGEADYKVRIKRLKSFLKNGSRVRVVVRFLGRQITKQNFGYQLIEKMSKEVKELGELEGRAKLMGKRLVVLFNPVRQKENGAKSEKKD